MRLNWKRCLGFDMFACENENTVTLCDNLMQFCFFEVPSFRIALTFYALYIYAEFLQNYYFISHFFEIYFIGLNKQGFCKNKYF